MQCHFYEPRLVAPLQADTQFAAERLISKRAQGTRK